MGRVVRSWACATDVELVSPLPGNSHVNTHSLDFCTIMSQILLGQGRIDSSFNMIILFRLLLGWTLTASHFNVMYNTQNNHQ